MQKSDCHLILGGEFGHKRARIWESNILYQFFINSLSILYQFFARAYINPYDDFDMNPDGYFQRHFQFHALYKHILGSRVIISIFEQIVQH